MTQKPKFRGVSHQIAFFVSLVTGAILVAVAKGFFEKGLVGAFALSITILFGVSALYHRITWSSVARERMRRLDHSSIYLLISGTYTPIIGLTLARDLAITVLAVVWGVSILGVFLELAVPRAPKWVAAIVYVAIGWIAIFVVRDIVAAIGMFPVILIAVGGLLYTLGAVVYALKRPNPAPAVFGYHEIFHLLVIAGAYLHYAVVGLYVIS